MFNRGATKSSIGRRVLGGAAFTVAAALVPGSGPNAFGCGGTPPPIDCGVTYNFASSGNLSLLASNLSQNATINTFHYIGLAGSSAVCPQLPYSVSITATLGCSGGGGSGTQTFGPFPLNEGENVIPIDIVVPAGGPRQCTVTLESTTTAGANTFTQTGTQFMCIADDADLNGQPDFTLTPGPSMPADGVIRFAPGNVAIFEYDVTNTTNQRQTADMTICSRNGAGPAAVGGPTSTFFGGWGTGDWLGDAHDVEFVDDFFEGCFPYGSIAAEPHLQTMGHAAKSYDFEAGETKRISGAAHSPALCGSGKCDTTQLRIFQTGQLKACAAVVTAVNFNSASGTCFGGPAASPLAFGGLGLDPGVGITSPVSPTWQFNIDVNGALSSFTVNGATATASYFSGTTMVEPYIRRVSTDFSFISPPPGSDAVLEATYTFDIRPASQSVSTIDPNLADIFEVQAAPTGYPDTPFAIGTVNVDPLISPPFQQNVAEFIHQVSTVIVTTDFNFYRGEVLEYEVLEANGDSYTIMVKTQLPPGASTSDILGFTVDHDFRAAVHAAFETAPVPGDGNCDNTLDMFDLQAFILALVNPDGFAETYPGCDILIFDFNEDGVVSPGDINLAVEFFGGAF